VKNNSIISVKRVLADDMKKYVNLILEEYGQYIPQTTKEFLKSIDDYSDRIVVQDTGTISMFATETEVIMPEGAYKIFKYLKMIPGYGINKKHKTYKDGEIVNENTYYDYIKHVLVSGMSVEEFFRDTLLHETMHFCGSDGGSAMREGLTELKTRELAQKHGLKASRCGYPKEVDIVNRFQEIVGKDIANQIAFAESNRQIEIILQKKCGNEVANLYFEISRLMDEELDKKYDHSKFGGILGPIKKARAYSSIDYSKIHEKIEAFNQERQSSNKKLELREQIRGCSNEKYEEMLKKVLLDYDKNNKSHREVVEMDR